jgi:hypothetical protein
MRFVHFIEVGTREEVWVNTSNLSGYVGVNGHTELLLNGGFRLLVKMPVDEVSNLLKRAKS